MPRIFKHGEYSEGMSWELEEDVALDVWGCGLRGVCRHAVLLDEQHVRVPRIIRAYNEGGYNSTQMCVDCLLDALAGVDPQ